MHRHIVRIFLIATLTVFIFEPWLPSLAIKGFAFKSVQAQTENGVGGGAEPEIILTETDPELEGIPEPEEFSRPHMLSFNSYVLAKGDVLGKIAAQAGLYEDTLISVNNVKNARIMQIGQEIKIPNQDGIYHTVQTGDSLEKIANRYKTTVSHISTVNELFSETIRPKEVLFIPGARMDWINKQEINGDLFIWPCSGYISSNYGYRMAPFAGSRQFHSGIDIGSSMGSPVRAAMAGRVTQVGANDYSWGNFVVITHHSGYRTFYAHMNVVRVKSGAYVQTGERIGDIGSTGLSTGPHLHFTVYKNGVTVNPRSLMR
jgi:murein DD-endopeptidase MepM/ murein hydrolase activator NlpD